MQLLSTYQTASCDGSHFVFIVIHELGSPSDVAIIHSRLPLLAVSPNMTILPYYSNLKSRYSVSASFNSLTSTNMFRCCCNAK